MPDHDSNASLHHPSIPRLSSTWVSRGWPDLVALASFIGVSLLVVWNRVVFDDWLTRMDLFTQLIPWYGYLGSRLRSGEIPAWNPSQLSGTPFAGHPLSGWMYVPAMAVFAWLPVLSAFKLFMAMHVLLAGCATYAYARVLGMGAVASLVAALAFACGPLLEWTTYTSLQFAQFAVWIPMGLLGIELALRQTHWRTRLLTWSIAALALSQMLAGWVGEGWIYAVLLLGSYSLYRGLSAWWPSLDTASLVRLVTTPIVVVGFGIVLGAAGVLPRLSVAAETSVAAGAYAQFGRHGQLNTPWTLRYLVTQLVGFGEGYHFRAAAFGGGVIVLALLALVLSPRRFAVPYFALCTGVALILTLHTTPLHQLMYLIPRYRELHEHDPWRVIAVAAFGPAMLAGASVQALVDRSWNRSVAPLLVAPFFLLVGISVAIQSDNRGTSYAPVLAALGMTLVVLGIVALDVFSPSRLPRWSVMVLAALLPVLIVLQPTGLELTGSWLGWPLDPRWERRWQTDPALEQALEAEVSPTDAGGAGAFLQQQWDSSGPFRYLGYGGVGAPAGGWLAASYTERRFDPDVLAILVNGRPLALGLAEVQGYDPIQLERYVAVVHAINGKGQDYHTAFVSDEGVDSPLLDVLDVRYVLVSGALPADRPDMTWIRAHSTEVFRGPGVIVYARQPAPPHAWIVHTMRSVAPGEALSLIETGKVDPYQTALVEGTVPTMHPVADPGSDQVMITAYAPERIEVVTHTVVPSLLVLSEIYADGWQATVNGTAVPIVLTDGALRGIMVPAGMAMVEVRYRPAALRTGIAFSLVGVVVFLLILLDAGYRSIRPRGPFASESNRPAEISSPRKNRTGRSNSSLSRRIGWSSIRYR